MFVINILLIKIFKDKLFWGGICAGLLNIFIGISFSISYQFGMKSALIFKWIILFLLIFPVIGVIKIILSKLKRKL